MPGRDSNAPGRPHTLDTEGAELLTRPTPPPFPPLPFSGMQAGRYRSLGRVPLSSSYGGEATPATLPACVQLAVSRAAPRAPREQTVPGFGHSSLAPLVHLCAHFRRVVK